jgi:hypothetical protein
MQIETAKLDSSEAAKKLEETSSQLEASSLALKAAETECLVLQNAVTSLTKEVAHLKMKCSTMETDVRTCGCIPYCRFST